MDSIVFSLRSVLAIGQGSIRVAVLLAGFVGFLLLRYRHPFKTVVGAKVHGYRAWFEPTFWLRTRFVTQGFDIIESGYKRFKDTPFIVRRYDADYSVLPIRYLEEIRLVPITVLSGRGAQVDNMMYRWTNLHFVTRSDLHVRVLRKKLSPELPRCLEIARRELDYGWGLDVPHPEEWTEVDIQQVIRMLIARMSAKIFLGEPACRNMEWLKISIDYSIDTFTTAFILRMFPSWSHFIVARLLPSRYRMMRQVEAATRIVGPEMKKHLEATERKRRDEEVEEEDTLMNWFIDNASEEEMELHEMAMRQCVLTLASIHTTTTSVTNALFDLCEHPEWFPVLREEFSEVVSEIGRPGERSDIGVRHWHPRLEKLDSFLVETLRFNPPIILNPQRLAVEPYTLSDGLHIPKGTKITFPGYHHLHNPEVVAEPEKFDPMRSFRKRHASPSDHTKYQASSTDINGNLAFGYGNQACPGRFFAVAEIKMILSRLLDELEFRFPEGTSRPRTLYADENSFVDPHARLMVRKRRML